MFLGTRFELFVGDLLEMDVVRFIRGKEMEETVDGEGLAGCVWLMMKAPAALSR